MDTDWMIFFFLMETISMTMLIRQLLQKKQHDFDMEHPGVLASSGAFGGKRKTKKSKRSKKSYQEVKEIQKNKNVQNNA